MALRGIDVSNWQSGIDVAAVDADFVIVKATGGTGYDSPSFRRQADAALASGKLLGAYHFAGDGCAGSAAAEAEHFLRAFGPYRGRAIPVLDWEADATSWPVSWAKAWLDRVAAETGATPWFYSYSSYINNSDCTPIRRYPLWLAAYYAGYRQMGYQDDPPVYGGTGAWDGPTCYQYSSSGRVAGYGSNLDINIFYGDKADWLAHCGGKSVAPNRKGKKMECLIRPNGENRMVYFDGSKAHPLNHPDEMIAIQTVYKMCNGADIPCFALGAPEAPWASRLFEGAGREM